MRALGASILALAVAGHLGGCGAIDPTVKETPVKIISEEVGVGRAAAAGDLVTIKYRILLPDGQVVLSDPDYSFELRTGVVILGVDDTVEGMRRRGKRVVECPPQKHWGRPGYGKGKIPPNTTLTIDIELLRIQ